MMTRKLRALVKGDICVQACKATVAQLSERSALSLAGILNSFAFILAEGI